MNQNRLGSEKSPYLLQHRDNPVHWYAWGEEAFKAAKQQNKLIFLSIGYSTCHWCHVMAHDSFESEDVAAVLNRHYISIKVDREERPDVDQIYMDAVVQMTGQGGWPMSVFLTPDLKPFFGATFFWKDQFIKLLSNIQEVWKSSPQKIIETGAELVEHLQTQNASAGLSAPDFKILDEAVKNFKSKFDPVNGGFGSAPKFPRTADLSFLLRAHHRSKDPQTLEMATRTLDRMAVGGIYDHLGGGFHRYSTDDKWLVPHFEKMLYDNALIAFAYLEAYQVTQKPLYAQVARETLDYVLNDMTDEDGGFYSAEDADTEGEEGKFYVWSETELHRALTPEEFDFIRQRFLVRPGGNFEGKTILNLERDWEAKADPLFQSARTKLLAARNKRPRPYKDDKILTDWNGLMIASFAKAAAVLDEPKYLKAAQKAAAFVQSRLTKTDRLLHRYRDGDAAIEGMLDDYVWMIFALCELYQADSDANWIHSALMLQKTQNRLFWDEADSGFFFASNQAGDLFSRRKEFHDGAIPSANAVGAFNLARLYAFTFDRPLLSQSQKILQRLSAAAARHPSAYASGLNAIGASLAGFREIAVIGRPEDPETRKTLRYLRHAFLPHQVFGFLEPGAESTLPLLQNKPFQNNQMTVYVCEGHVCKKPVHTLTEIQKLMEDSSL